jgi:hypothetical protein
MQSSQQFCIRLLGGDYATHMTCQEAGCEAWARGWLNVIDPQNVDQAQYATDIKRSSGLTFYEFRSERALEEIVRREGSAIPTMTDVTKDALGRLPPGLIVFVFPPGQTCFKVHEDREVKFLHNRYEHTRPLDWNEDFNEEGYKVNRMLERG